MSARPSIIDPDRTSLHCLAALHHACRACRCDCHDDQPPLPGIGGDA